MNTADAALAAKKEKRATHTHQYCVSSQLEPKNVEQELKSENMHEWLEVHC